MATSHFSQPQPPDVAIYDLAALPQYFALLTDAAPTAEPA